MSTLRTNALEGVDAKNSITIVAGAGNITTTNVQEGLGLSYCNFDGTGTASITKSFNASSLNDDGTGLYDVNFTSTFNDADYCSTEGARSEGTFINPSNHNTSALCAIGCVNSSGSAHDIETICLLIHGDLA